MTSVPLPTSTGKADDDDQRMAEGVALLRVCIMLHERRRTMFDAAVNALCSALDAAVDARDAYLSVGDTLLEATRYVARLRGRRA
jgi:hypothetical protein